MSDPIINTKITADTKQAEQAVNTLKRSIEDMGRDSSESAMSTKSAWSDAISGIGSSWANMASAFAAGNIITKALDVVLEKLSMLKEAVKDAILMSARYETLGVVMKVVGANAGYTASQMAGFQKGLQATGISAIEARQGLMLMGQAQVDMANSSKLARIAQDAAVIGNINSSEAFNRMMTGLATGQSILMHHLGLMTNFETAYLNAAHAAGKTTNDLTEVEKAQIRVNEVLRAGVGISGSYEAAMGTAGKQLNSMKRYVDDLMVQFGGMFQGALIAGVTALANSLKYVSGHFEEIKIAAMGTASVMAGAAMYAAAPLMLSLAGAVGTVLMAVNGFAYALVTADGAAIAATFSFNALKVAMATNPLGLIVAALTTAVGLWMTYIKVQSDAIDRNAPKDNPVLVTLREEVSLLQSKIDLIKKSKGLETVTDSQVLELKRLEMQKQFIKDQDGSSGAGFRVTATEMERANIEKLIPQVAALKKEYTGLIKEKDKPSADGGISQYNTFVDAFNGMITAIEEADPALSAHEKALMKIQDASAKLALSHPKEAAEIAKVTAWVTQETKSYQDQADAIKETSNEFKNYLAAMGYETPQHNDAGQFSVANEELLKLVNTLNGQTALDDFNNQIRKLNSLMTEAPERAAEISSAISKLTADFNAPREAAKALRLEMELATINSNEKFYKIGPNDASTQRIANAQQMIGLLKVQYNSVQDSNTAEQTRVQILAKIRGENEKILDQQKAIYDRTAVGGMTNAIQQYGKTADDVGAQVKNAFTNAFQGMEDALVNFVMTGKLSLKSLITQLETDIVRMAVKQALNGVLATITESTVREASAVTAVAILTAGAEAEAAIRIASATSAASIMAGGTATGGAVAGGAAAGGAASTTGYMALATTLAPVIAGAIIVGAAGIIIGGLFGLGSTKDFDRRGTTINVTGETVTGYNWHEWFSDGGLLGSDSSGKEIVAFTKEQQEFYSNTILAVNVGIRQMAAVAGKSNADIKLMMNNINGSFSSIQEYTSAQLMKIYPELYKTFIDMPQLSQLVAKTTAKTTERVGTNTQSIYINKDEVADDAAKRIMTGSMFFNTILKQAGSSLLDTSIATGHAASKLITALGGMDKAQEQLNGYYSSSLFSKEEQTAGSIASATYALKIGFASVGEELPATAKGIREFMDAQIMLSGTLGPAGDKARIITAALLPLTPAMNTLGEAATSTADAATAAAEKLSALQKTNNSLMVTLLELQGNKTAALALSRKLEIDGLDISTISIKQQIWALQDLKTAADEATAATEKYTSAKKTYDDLMTAAILKGLQDIVATQSKMATEFATRLNKVLDTKLSALDVRKRLISGDASTLTPEQKYFNAKAAFTAGNADYKVANSESFLSMSKEHSSSNLEYMKDFIDVTKSLGEIGGMANTTDLTLKANQDQVTYLQNIRDQLIASDASQNVYLADMASGNSGLTGLLTKYLTANQTAIEKQAQADAINVAAETERIRLATVAATAQLTAATLTAETTQKALFDTKMQDAFTAYNSGGTLAALKNTVTESVATYTPYVTAANAVGANKTAPSPLPEVTYTFLQPGYDRDWLGRRHYNGTDLYANNLGKQQWVNAGEVPAFAAGTNYLPSDMIAQVHEGERIIPKADNYELMQRLSAPAENGSNKALEAKLEALLNEVQQLRNEQKAGHVAIAKNTGDSAKQLRRWDGEGTPPVRAAA